MRTAAAVEATIERRRSRLIDERAHLLIDAAASEARRRNAGAVAPPIARSACLKNVAGRGADDEQRVAVNRAAGELKQ